MNIEVPNELHVLAQKRGITSEEALQQVFNLGWGDWKSRGRSKKPVSFVTDAQKAEKLKLQVEALKQQALARAARIERQAKEAERRTLKLKLQAEGLQLRLDQRARRALKLVVRAGLAVMCPDGSKAILDGPSPVGKGLWLAHAEGNEPGTMSLPVKLIFLIA